MGWGWQAGLRGGASLELLGDDGRGDELQLRDVSNHLVVRDLVEEHEVGELLLHLALGPLLFLGLAAPARRGLCLLLGRHD